MFFQEVSSEGFNRYDMIVRLLAIENYYGKNEYGFNLYRKMQAARIGIDSVEPAVFRFRKLIESYENNGYDSSSEIELDSCLHLYDGSHRMAMALYYNYYY